MEHYLEEAMHQLETAAALCREGHPIQPAALDQLHMQAEFAVQFGGWLRQRYDLQERTAAAILVGSREFTSVSEPSRISGW